VQLAESWYGVEELNIDEGSVPPGEPAYDLPFRMNALLPISERVKRTEGRLAFISHSGQQGHWLKKRTSGNALLAFCSHGPATCDQWHNENYQEKHKQNFCNSSCHACQAEEAEQSGNDRNNQEHQRPTQHSYLLLNGFFSSFGQLSFVFLGSPPPVNKEGPAWKSMSREGNSLPHIEKSKKN
jgi:hypothetical protein